MCVKCVKNRILYPINASNNYNSKKLTLFALEIPQQVQIVIQLIEGLHELNGKNQNEVYAPTTFVL